VTATLDDQTAANLRIVAARMYRRGAPHSFADLVQVATEAALEAHRLYPGCNLSFVCKRAEWRILDLYQRTRQEVLTDGVLIRGLDETPAVDGDPYEHVERGETVATVRRMIRRAKLTKRQQAAIDLLYGRDLTESEAAEALGMTPLAVKMLRHRALEKLRAAA